MHTGTIVRKFAGKEIPTSFWEKLLLAQGGNVYGMGFAEKGELIWQALGEPSLSTLMSVQEHFMDSEIIFYVGVRPEGSSEEDNQPFVVQTTDAGDPVILAFMDGDFSQYALAGSTRSDSFFACENLVVPNVQELWDLTEGNIEKVMKGMSHKARENAFENASLKRGVITLLATTGEIKTFSKNTLGGEFEWGQTSNLHGYEEKTFPVKEEVKPAVTGKGNLAERMKGIIAPAKSKEEVKAPISEHVGPSSEVKKPLIAPSDPKPTVLHQGKLKESTAEPLMETINLQGLSNKEKKRLFERHLGHTPDNWRKLNNFQAPVGSATKVVKTGRILKDLSQLADGIHEVKPTEVKEPEVKPKDVEPHEVKPEVARPSGPSVQQTLIPVSQKQDFEKKFLNSVAVKALRDKGVVLPSPEDIQKMEKKIPSFSEHTGRNIEETFAWEPAELLLLIKEYPDLACSLMQTFRIGYMKNFKPHVKATEEAPKKKSIIAA